MGNPAVVEHTILGVIGCFLVNSGHICDRGAALCCRTPLLSSNNFTQGCLMKIEWIVTDGSAVRSPDRPEHAILEVMLAGRFVGKFRPHLWSFGHFVM